MKLFELLNFSSLALRRLRIWTLRTQLKHFNQILEIL